MLSTQARGHFIRAGSVSAFIADGYSLYCLLLQPLLPKATASIAYGYRAEDMFGPTPPPSDSETSRAANKQAVALMPMTPFG